MKTHHLSLFDAFNDNFHLIAIYSDEEDYRMAFILNEQLDLRFAKTSSIVTQKEAAKFTVFEYDEDFYYRNWFLLQNHSFIEKETTNSNDLFSLNSSKFQQKVYFFKKIKKASFFLKIVTDEENVFVKDLTKKLQAIPQIYATEVVLLTKKSEKNKFLF